MKKNLFLKIILILIMSILIMTNKSFAENVIQSSTEKEEEFLLNNTNEFIEKANVKVYYIYDEKNNTVIAIINSDVELEDTKPTWELSEDKKQYTKLFTSNMTYTTPVQDINGNIIEVEIQITQVKPLEVEVEYEYNETTNQVLVKMISNMELEDTKPTWELSEDKKQYTKLFTSNTTYTTPVQDINGNIIEVEIQITQVKPLEVEVEYEYIKVKNQLLVRIISNIELADTKPTWELSEDKKQYTKLFTSDTTYTTPVQDINGNIVNVNILVDQIGKNIANIDVKYEYDNILNKVQVSIISDIELIDTKPTWELSDDKLIYTKQFSENTTYTTPVVDICGNIIDVNITINNIDITAPQITLEYKFNEDDTVTINLISNEPLGNTKPTWTLSEDEFVYSKIFSVGDDYTTPVQDKYGNVTNVNINFKIRKFIYKQEDDSEIKIRYLYRDGKQVLVEIITSKKMLPTKPTWTLSEDGYKYSKNFYNNDIYITPIQYEDGTIHNAYIIINLFGDYVTGIDVSKHQGKIDWQQVKNAGIEFAIIRCGYGQDRTSQDDEMFEYNVSECERLGIPYGIYLYSYAVDLDCANSEADHVLRLIKGKNPTYGIWYDLEEELDEFGNVIPNDMLVNIAITFCEKIKANGYDYVGIYANLNWLQTKLNDERLDQYPKWVAQWNDECTYEKEYDMWQYTSSGQIPGIEGNVDLDRYYKQR